MEGSSVALNPTLEIALKVQVKDSLYINKPGTQRQEIADSKMMDDNSPTLLYPR